jgi:hypothetical protein
LTTAYDGNRRLFFVIFIFDDGLGFYNFATAARGLEKRNVRQQLEKTQGGTLAIALSFSRRWTSWSFWIKLRNSVNEAGSSFRGIPKKQVEKAGEMKSSFLIEKTRLTLAK